MSKKLRIAILTIIILGLAAVLLLPALNGSEQVEEAADPALADPVLLAEYPYQAYQSALREGRPIVLEFYARW